MRKENLHLPFKIENYKQLKRPSYLIVLLHLFNFISSIISICHTFAIKRNWIKVPSIILESPYNSFFTIKEIWISRMLRRSLSLLIRTPFSRGTLSLINYKLSLPTKTGCIIAIPHTPWSRLLAEWCRENKFAFVLVGGKWITRTESVNIPGGFSGIKQLIKHLHSGGRIIVIGDNIGRWRCCSVKYFGKKCNASIIPARLAASAGVPLLAVYPKLGDGMINIYNGYEASIKDIKTNQKKVMQKVFNFFENEIRNTPSIYEPFVLKSLNAGFMAN